MHRKTTRNGLIDTSLQRSRSSQVRWPVTPMEQPSPIFCSCLELKGLAHALRLVNT